MCRPRVGVANSLFSLRRALWRPTAPGSRTKSRRTAEESRTRSVYITYQFLFFQYDFIMIILCRSEADVVIFHFLVAIIFAVKHFIFNLPTKLQSQLQEIPSKKQVLVPQISSRRFFFSFLLSLKHCNSMTYSSNCCSRSLFGRRKSRRLLLQQGIIV